MSQQLGLVLKEDHPSYDLTLLILIMMIFSTPYYSQIAFEKAFVVLLRLRVSSSFFAYGLDYLYSGDCR